MPDNWARYQRHPSLVLGFHGTEKVVVNRVVSRQDPHLKASEGRYDGLGYDIYFGENDPQRG